MAVFFSQLGWWALLSLRRIFSVLTSSDELGHRLGVVLLELPCLFETFQALFLLDPPLLSIRDRIGLEVGKARNSFRRGYCTIRTITRMLNRPAF